MESTHFKKAAHFLKEAALETLWPTRCAICDAPGQLICDTCRASLPFIDLWQACPSCGAPFGAIQCSECNAIVLKRAGLSRFPFNAAASALPYSTHAKRIISSYKDKGEQRMAHLMAEIMAPYTNPVWRSEASILTFIPSTAQAKRNRGFDQAELLAQELSCILDIPYASFFMRPKSRDQRKLSRIERVANLNGHINTLPKTSVPKKILLIDDVCTTGATLAAATVALQNAGAECVWCLTFARTC